MPRSRSARAQTEETPFEEDARLEQEIEDDWRRSPWDQVMAQFVPHTDEKDYNAPVAQQWSIRIKAKYCPNDLNLGKKVKDWLKSEEVDLTQKPINQRYAVYWNSSDTFFSKDYKSLKLCEGWVVQAWGERENRRCKRCTIDQEDNGMPTGYLECRTIDPIFDGCCGNCKRDEKGRECEHDATLKKIKKDAAKEYAAQHCDNRFDKSPRDYTAGSNDYLP